jgi:type I restriction enzyme R subunit
MKFPEAQLESAIIALLAADGYPHVLGETIARQPQEVFLSDFQLVSRTDKFPANS